MGIESNLRTQEVKENFDFLTKNRENLCLAKRSVINKLDLQYFESPMVIEHFAYVYMYTFFIFLHALLPSLTLDCNKQPTEGLEDGTCSELLVSRGPA